MTKLIVFTDTHIVSGGGRIIGIDPNERLRRGIAHVNKNHADAALVIFTGDLVDKGSDAAAYECLKEITGELTIPCQMMIGNHDRRENFLRAFPQAPIDANGFVQTAIETPQSRLLLLDTLFAPPYEYPKAYSGYLCEQRLDWLETQLQSSSKPVTIFLHHPPHPTGFLGMDGIALQNGEAFYACVKRHNNVQHVVAGHVHRTISGSHRGIPFSVFKSTAHQQPMDLASDSNALSVNEPGAYGILLLQDHGVVVHTEDFELTVAHQLAILPD